MGIKRSYLEENRRLKELPLEMVPKLLLIINRILSSHPEITFAYLYGSCISQSKGEKGSSPPADVDVAVYIREGDLLKTELDLQLQFHRQTGLPPEVLDVRNLNQAPLSVAIEIIARGKLIFCRDEEVHTDFVESVGRSYRQLRSLIGAAYG